MTESNGRPHQERILVGDRVTIYRRGAKGVWCADFWRNGQHRRQSLKTTNKKVAVERATKLAASLVDGSFQQAPPAVAIAEAMEQYLECLRTDDRARRTLVKYRGVYDLLREFLKSVGVTRLGQFTANHFDRFRSMRRQTCHPKTLYNHSVIVKQLFRWARRRRMIVENPIEDIKLAKPRLEPKPGPDLSQIDRILVATTGQLHAMLAVLAFTGMRSGDLQRLRVEDVDLAGNWLHIVSRQGAETKSRLSRKVPIHPRLRAILVALPRPAGPWFFTAPASRRYPDGHHYVNTKKLNERFASLLKKLKLPVGRDKGYVIHSLRHSFETICVNAGIPQRVVDTWLGHTADRSMAAVYYRLSDEESQRFMLKVPFGKANPSVENDKECEQ